MFVVLFLLWLIFAGQLSWLNCAVGACVSACLTAFCWKYMGYRPARARHLLQKTGKAVCYVLFLLKEIFLSNLAVVRGVYSRKAVEPRLVHFRTDLRTDAARVLLANSITLTPGTITVETRDGEYWVHGLDKSLTAGIERCAFLRKARELEGGHDA